MHSGQTVWLNMTACCELPLESDGHQQPPLSRVFRQKEQIGKIGLIMAAIKGPL